MCVCAFMRVYVCVCVCEVEKGGGGDQNYWGRKNSNTNIYNYQEVPHFLSSLIGARTLGAFPTASASLCNNWSEVIGGVSHSLCFIM